jgi:hypothetical protein
MLQTLHGTFLNERLVVMLVVGLRQRRFWFPPHSHRLFCVGGQLFEHLQQVID